MRILRLDDVPAPVVDGGRWLPLRAELGIEAFGVSAYLADPGEVVVPRHREESGGGAGGHDELYVVLRGRATFAVGDDTIDAPRGTLVFVPAGETREARAEEPRTAVLVVGATPGEAYSVPPWEYGARVERERKLRNWRLVEQVADEGIARYGEHPTMLFAKACVAAERGDRGAAAELLRRALEDGPYVRDWIADEPVLAGVDVSAAGAPPRA